jgi:hypothetical protein
VRALIGSLILVLLSQASPAHAQEAETLERAHHHYESGVSLFESGNKEQALVEFKLANETVPKPENVFMIAQCEYHLGKLVDARAHYRAFLTDKPQGELADLARLRIEAINRRPGVFMINTVPDGVDVRIEGEGQTITSQAPNEFPVPHGHYRVTVSKSNFASEAREISIEVAETKPLFFKLEPIPAHLTVRTDPPTAALFVRGNRTQNPYIQDVPPGIYEIYAEAPYYQSKRETIVLGPGETREVDFPLTYVQRSGRPELIGFWTGIGAAGGGMAILSQGNPTRQSASLVGTMFGAGLLAGGLGLGVLASTTPLVPSYIRDNLALFRIGSMWVGDLEGATLAMALSQDWGKSFLGGLGGLGVGVLAGWWLDDKAPNYGRVATIQSAALIGAALGALSLPALGEYPKGDSSTNEYRIEAKRKVAWGMLAGLNVGLAAGLSLAYLPDQHNYGPTWQRVIMIDLAGIAGALLASAVEVCSQTTKEGEKTYCANNDHNQLTQRTARFAFVGAGLGLVAGWLLTMNYDKRGLEEPSPSALSLLPLPGVVPVQSTTGTVQLLPGLTSQGRF